MPSPAWRVSKRRWLLPKYAPPPTQRRHWLGLCGANRARVARCFPGKSAGSGGQGERRQGGARHRTAGSLTRGPQGEGSLPCGVVGDEKRAPSRCLTHPSTASAIAAFVDVDACHQAAAVFDIDSAARAADRRTQEADQRVQAAVALQEAAQREAAAAKAEVERVKETLSREQAEAIKHEKVRRPCEQL